MSKLFILGTGFSKAVSDKLPTMKDLGEHVKSKINELPGHEAYEKLISDPNNVEVLLTYLYQDMPWETASQLYLKKSAFLQVSQTIADYIAECERKLVEVRIEPPDWTEDFIKYLIEKKVTVATFNYDRILECLLLKYIMRINFGKVKINFPFMYNVPLTPLSNRTGEVRTSNLDGSSFSDSTKLHNKLLKLHGSINWYYSGDPTLAMQQVYYSDDYITFMVSEKFPWAIYDARIKAQERIKSDLTPLIIPPVAEKNSFYGITLVKTLWRDFYKEIKKANEIYCIGYSLPQTDLSTRIFFSAVMDDPNKKVYLVNLKEGSDDLISNYKKILKNCDLDLIEKYISDDEPIKQFVEDLVK